MLTLISITSTQVHVSELFSSDVAANPELKMCLVYLTHLWLQAAPGVSVKLAWALVYVLTQLLCPLGIDLGHKPLLIHHGESTQICRWRSCCEQ